MKKIMLLAILATLVAGCSQDVHNNVRTLRVLHADYRARTVAKNPTETAQVEKIAENLEGVMKNLDELTR